VRAAAMAPLGAMASRGGVGRRSARMTSYSNMESAGKSIVRSIEMRILVHIVCATLVMSAGAHAERQVMNDRELAATVAGVEQSSFAREIQHTTIAAAKTSTRARPGVTNVVISSSAFASTRDGNAIAIAKASITPGHLRNRPLELSCPSLGLASIFLR